MPTNKSQLIKKTLIHDRVNC